MARVRYRNPWRCADGHVLLCTYGANLPCGKANSDRDLDFVPRFAIPWGNIYNWGCGDGTRKVIARIEDIDPRGFVARYWKPAD